MIAVAITNPNILGVEALLGPIIVATVFFMPLIAIYKLPVLHKYRKNRVANAFIALTGLAAFSTLIYRFIAA
jgi:serine transporter